MPSSLDLTIATKLLQFAHQHPDFTYAVQSAMRHNVLGGFWFALALFYYWSKARAGDQAAYRQLMRIFTATIIAIGTALLLSIWIQWLPPSRTPGLEALYPPGLDANPNTNSFPSMSTTLYSCVAAGIFAFSAAAGGLLWIAVGLLIALPRMFVGGHYLTDVIAGFFVGIISYVLSGSFLKLLPKRCMPDFSHLWARAATCVIFIWILQVAVEFNDAVWVRHALERFVQ